VGQQPAAVLGGATKLAGVRQNGAIEHEMERRIHQSKERSTRISPSYTKRKERRRRRRSTARRCSGSVSLGAVM
jgi:hypothetical protein